MSDSIKIVILMFITLVMIMSGAFIFGSAYEDNLHRDMQLCRDRGGAVLPVEGNPAFWVCLPNSEER